MGIASALVSRTASSRSAVEESNDKYKCMMDCGTWIVVRQSDAKCAYRMLWWEVFGTVSRFFHDGDFTRCRRLLIILIPHLDVECQTIFLEWDEKE